ncbi:hypothetical protein HPB48_019540 [Haemaphysalis longicornis]|uniref:small monomeric GTPase n=1 Tax=Haemaphysalis longicornis TaxID=44386 RepID=A0A9J6GZN2_HAELO|nr:hypothetical protein HPB48_019540 [Haemaphysalis longicornis]
MRAELACSSGGEKALKESRVESTFKKQQAKAQSSHSGKLRVPTQIVVVLLAARRSLSMHIATVAVNRKGSGLSPICIMVMGSSVGKSAATVRFLTQRFISEYSSLKDLLYRHTVLVDNRTCELEILDTSRNQVGTLITSFPEDKIASADALVVVYSIEDRWSFEEASSMPAEAQQLCPCLPTILVANKGDLSHVRQVDVDDGRQLSLSIQCQFYVVSAADSYAQVSMAFQSILR